MRVRCDRDADFAHLDRRRRLARLATDKDAIEATYLATLSRRPTPEELAAFQESLSKRRSGRSRDQAVEDMYWVLLNSTEFSWNH